MNIQNRKVELTTNHAASSYGVPVLVIDGAAFGPADETPIEVAGRTSALGVVRYLVEEGELTPEAAAQFGNYKNATA